MRTLELMKKVVYRTPLLRRAMSPQYRYKISPGQLAAIIDLIESTNESGSSVVEIGVAQGDTSVFILEHLRSTSQARPIFFVDTFSGFTAESVTDEVVRRGKDPKLYDAFQYGNRTLFDKNLAQLGYSGYHIIEADAITIDWSTIGPIGAALLDIDLYKPTISVLKAIWPHIVPSGGIVVDDCLPDTPWDGALEAVNEFVEYNSLPFVRVGSKGALIRKN